MRAVYLPVKKGEQIKNAQAWQNMPIDLGHELALGSVDERREIIVGVVVLLAWGRAAVVALCFDVYKKERKAVSKPPQSQETKSARKRNARAWGKCDC